MKRAIAWFAGNRVAANLMMMFIVVAGIASLGSIDQKTFPDIEVDIIQIVVPYLGAAPEEVEEGVCIRIEEEIHGIEGIDRINSNANEGACGVIVELVANTSTDRALSEIKNAVDGITTFPEQTEKPIVSHYTIKRNALKLALSGDVGERALRLWGERIRDEIAALPGVTQVELQGARDYEISIEVPEVSLRRHGITFDQVVRAVRRSSIDLPGGSLRTTGGEILLRAKGQAYTGSEFERIVVLTRSDGTRLLLGDIATVNDGFEQDERRATFDGQHSVMIQVLRVGDQRILELTDTVMRHLEGLRPRLPDGLTLTVWQNDSRFLRDRLNILLKNGFSGFLLVLTVLTLFLRLRLAFWVALGVPVSMMGALWMFPVVGQSIDVLSLFAFILVLGLLVDDAIVIGENVHTHQERSEAPLTAAIAGTQEVAIPVIFGILTTVAAFLPLIVAEGVMGDFFGTIGTVVIICLFFSLIESQLILPAHLGHSARKPVRKLRQPHRWQQRLGQFQNTMASSLTRLAHEGYRPLLERALAWRYSVLAFALALLIITTTTVSAGYLRFTFMPEIESDFIDASLSMPPGTPLEVTEAAVAVLERSAAALRAELDAEVRADNGDSVIEHLLTTIGEPSQAGSGPRPGVDSNPSGPHLGGVAIELVGSDHRSITATEVVDRWRRLTPPIPGVEELIFNAKYLDAGDPIYVQLSSPDIEQLRRAADQLKARVAQYAGVYDVTDSWQDGKQELRLSIRPEAEPLGLALEDLALQVRHAFYGAEAQRIQRGRDDIRVMVRYPEQRRRSLDDLEELRIRTPDGGEVPFYAVAQATRGRGYSTIRRADRQRVIGVIADVDAERANANQISQDLAERVLPRMQADFPGLDFSFEGEQSEYQETATGLVRDFGLALFLIYFLLAVPLRSYTQPLIIMAVIPFGLVGAIVGHLLLGVGFSMMSVFGVVALAGVVVNSSLVLVHYINRRRSDGAALRLAVSEAGVARFRPIVLTSLTTAASLTPLLLERSMGAQFLIPMAISLAFGVVFATTISLFLVPCSYVILDDLSKLLTIRRRSSDAQLEVAPTQQSVGGAR